MRASTTRMMIGMWFLFSKSVASFLMTGMWKIASIPNSVILDVGQMGILGTTDNGVRIHTTQIRWGKQQEDEDTFMLTIEGLNVEKYPSDWMNYFKYKDYIDIFRRVREGGLMARLRWVDEDQIQVVSTRIGNEENEIMAGFLLKRCNKK